MGFVQDKTVVDTIEYIQSYILYIYYGFGG